MTKKLVLRLVVLSVFRAGESSAQKSTWKSLTVPPVGLKYEDVFFISPDVGWAVRPVQYHYDTVFHRIDSMISFGQVLKTTDGGLTWITQLDSTRCHLRSIRFVDSLHGWAGSYGTNPNIQAFVDSTLLFETTDGGSHWNIADSKIIGEKPAGLCGMYACDTSNVYMTGRFSGSPHVLKTTDGGKRWVSIDMSKYAARLIDVYFWSRDSGIVVGGTTPVDSTSSALILSTFDGGLTWEERYRSDSMDGWCWKISFPTRMTGYVSIEGEHTYPPVGFNCYFLKTTDGGITWKKKLLWRKPYNLEAIGFITEKVGWAGGFFKGVYVTTDGGDTWKYGDATPDVANRFRFFGDTLAYCAGASIYKVRVSWSSGDVKPEPTPVPSKLSAQTYPNPFRDFAQVHFTLSKTSRVTLKVFDILGDVMLSLLDEERPPGEYTIPLQIDAKSERSLPPGTYVCELRAGNEVSEQRIVHLR